MLVRRSFSLGLASATARCRLAGRPLSVPGTCWFLGSPARTRSPQIVTLQEWQASNAFCLQRCDPFSSLASLATTTATSEASDTSSDLLDYVTPMHVDEEFERFKAELTGSPPRLSEPTRAVAMFVAAGTTGRADILSRSFELLQHSKERTNARLLSYLLKQVSRVNDAPTIIAIIQSILDNRLQSSPQKQFPFALALESLLDDSVRKKDAHALTRALHYIDVLGVTPSVTMRAKVEEMVKTVGLDSLLSKPAATQHSFGPLTCSLLVHCVTRLATKDKEQAAHMKRHRKPIIQLGNLAKEVMKSNKMENHHLYSNLLMLYRSIHDKFGMSDLLLSYDQYNVQVTTDLMDRCIPGLGLKFVDEVLHRLRTKGNQFKRYWMFYRNVVANLTHSDSVSDFLNYFVKNFRLDLPDKVIEADLLNLAMRSFAYRQQVDSATAIFNLMLPVPERLPCKIEVETEPFCSANPESFSIYFSILAKASQAEQSAKDELFLLGKQAFEIAQKSGVELFHQAYESMIQLCVNTKQMGYADFVFETGKEVEYIPTSETGALLVKGFYAIGNNIYANKLRQTLNDLKTFHS